MKKLSFLLLIFTSCTFQACDDPADIKITERGTTEPDGNKIVISGSDEIILLTGIEWHEKTTDGSAGALKDKLSALPPDYRILLKKHVAEHSDFYFLCSAGDFPPIFRESGTVNFLPHRTAPILLTPMSRMPWMQL
jgi:hypothetical protein